MPMSLSRLSVGDPEMEHGIRAVLEQLGVPESEDWTSSITSSTATGAWEAVFDGVPRIKSDHVDWEIVGHEGAARYRRLFVGKDEQTLDYFKRSVRKLLWEGVQFKDNPIRTHNPKLGEAFEEVVWNLLRHEDLKPVRARFGVWREGPDGMRFVCKIEYASDRRVPWSWWSSLVRSPQDLATELTRALANRRKRQVVVAPSLRALGRRVARRGLRPTLPVNPAAPPAAARLAAPEAKDHRIGV
jgi:hypothetical protein